MHGVSTVIVVILILMISVALSALVYTFFTKVMTSVTTSGSTAINQTIASTTALMKVESMSINTVYIRNIGKSDLSGFSVYVNDASADAITPSVVKPSEVGAITITDFIKENDDIRITTSQGTLASKKAPDPCDQAVLCLNFDEGSGTVARDSSPYGNDGTLRNATGSCGGTACPSWVTGKYGNALDFDGIGDYIEIPDKPELRIPLGQNFSISFWIKTYESNSQRDISYKAVSDFWLVRIGQFAPVGYIWAQFHNGTHSATASSSIAINNGVWHYVGVTYTASTGVVKVYIDGSDRTSPGTIYTNIAVVNTAPVRISMGGLSGGFLNATIDEVRIYNKAIY